MAQEKEVEVLAEQAEENPFVAKFEQFFEHVYKKQIERLAAEYPEKRSLVIDFKDLERFDFELSDSLLENPDYVLEAASIAIQHIDVPTLSVEEFAPFIRFFNLPKDRQPYLRDIGAEHLGKLISVEGVIRQITDVLPKLKVAAWECRRCGNKYKINQSETGKRMPALCECKHKDFRLIPEESEFIDHQKIEIQEPLEYLRGSEQAVNLEINVTHDLVNKVSAGDRTRIVGILRLRPPKEPARLVFRRYLEAIHLEETAKEFEEVEVTKEEEEKIKELAKNPKIYDMITASIAPAIYGHEIVKESIGLQLFGGVKKLLPGKTSIRGNIHILLVGDPGVAKSAILQAVNIIAPKSIYTAGKTTSGVGLCVAPDSLVLNENGFKEIKDFVEEKFNEKNADEELIGAFSNKVEGLNSIVLNDNLKMEEKPVEKIWRIKAPEKMVEIKVRSGKSLSITQNTKLLRIKENRTEWVKSNDLSEGDFVATARKLPEGKAKEKYCVEVLNKNENIRIKNNVSKKFTEITNKLTEKYSSLQDIAAIYKLKRERMYMWRSGKFYQGMPLYLFLEMGIDAGFELKELAQEIKELFIRYGKNFRVPLLLNDERIAYLAGLVLGDGNIYLGRGSTQTRIYNTSEQILQEIDVLCYELFGIKPEKLQEKGKVPGRRIKFSFFYDIIKEFGVNNKKIENKISCFASELPNNILLKFLQGLFDTDGYTSKSSFGSPHVGLGTISFELARTLQLCLLKFGIHSKLRLRKKAGTIAKGKEITVKSNNDQYCIEIRGKENLVKFRKKIEFNLKEKKDSLNEIISSLNSSGTNIDLIPEISGLLGKKGNWGYRKGKTKPSREKLKELNEKIGNELLDNLANSDLFWEEVIKKREIIPSYEYVYDFTVNGAHNFISNGFFVHNTASAEKDEFGEGGWTLKAGALVLASGGIGIVDEFDKMDEDDRSAMHEAMEQEMISVAKAGIVTRFKTETSILAAANPKFARFDPFTPYMEQINLPPTLVSRFDLFFLIKDVLDRVKDEEIATHILMTHQAGEIIIQEKKSGKKVKAKELEELEKIITPPIEPDLLKKYIAYARQHIAPILTEEATKAISEFYLNLRELGKKEGSYAATHRQLEGLVRLSEASARVRLNDKVEKEDAERAIRLVRASLQEVVVDPTTGKIDIDLITSGQPHSKIQNLRVVLNIIREKAREMDMVPVIDIVEESATQGIEKDKVNDIINELKRRGEVYEKRHGFIDVTEKK
ncbi:MAG: LAGLIDADG family homing endonuclease [Candidatus Diapherotrites archaeon]